MRGSASPPQRILSTGSACQPDSSRSRREDGVACMAAPVVLSVSARRRRRRQPRGWQSRPLPPRVAARTARAPISNERLVTASSVSWLLSPGLLAHRQEEIRQGPVSDHHPLGSSSGARGVDDVCRVPGNGAVRSRSTGRTHWPAAVPPQFRVHPKPSPQGASRQRDAAAYRGGAVPASVSTDARRASG